MIQAAHHVNVHCKSLFTFFFHTIHHHFLFVYQLLIDLDAFLNYFAFTINKHMTAIEIQDFIHIYSMFSFRNGSKEPGIVINKYNLALSEVEYFFIPQLHMQAYKTAFEKYDKETCARLCTKLNIAEIINIRPVSLSDYKIIMQLLEERNQRLNLNR